MKRKRPSARRYQMMLALLGGCAMLVLLYMGGRWLEQRDRAAETRSDHTLRYAYEPTIEVDGKRYQRRSQITTILLIGVDQAHDAPLSGYRNGGQADFLRLLVIDDAQKTVSQVQIDRDTMTPITVLGVTGKPAGMRNAQISLSHGFGDGGQQSCALTVDAVSNLLLDTDIDGYIALDMDGVPILNDWVGGVTVTLQEDMTAVDPSMRLGASVTLNGRQAEAFVRSRMNVGDGTNAARMQRQQTYIAAFSKALERKISGDQGQLGTMLEALDGYLLTDMARGRIINEYWAARDYAQLPLIKPSGVHAIGADGFMEFTADAKEIQQIVLDLIYQEISF